MENLNVIQQPEKASNHIRKYTRQSHLQLLHKSHDVEHHLSSNHLVLFVEATLQHSVLHTRTVDKGTSWKKAKKEGVRKEECMIAANMAVRCCVDES